jgi:phosphomannomutase
MQKAVIFDLDNTLAEPFHPPTLSVLQKFAQLTKRTPVAIMSAASFERIKSDVLALLPPAPLEKLTLFTANAAQCYAYSSKEWSPQYRYGFTREELENIRSALAETVRECGIDTSRSYGEQFVDYEGYVAFTALGVDAPSSERATWDPDQAKRQKLRDVLQKKVPEFDVFIGGATSVDVTPKGINKEFGVRWYAKFLGAQPEELLYVGDALYEGGNDHVVIQTGVVTRAVAHPAETEKVIDELLAM